MPGGDSCKIQKTEGDKICSTVDKKETAGKLPEELVEKIISRIPFPSLFKAIVLSRPWYFKFPLASQLPRSLSLSFQNHVSSVSYKWSTYCPVFISQEEILGYDRASSQWKHMMEIEQVSIHDESFVACAGPLVCVANVVEETTKELRSLDVFVTNALTRSRTNIPAFSAHRVDVKHVKITMNGPNRYKVVVVVSGKYGVGSMVYDSINRNMSLWSNGSVDIGSKPNHCVSAYLNGKLYLMCDHQQTKKMRLWIHDDEKGTWESISHSTAFDNVADCGVLLCGNKVMVVVCMPIGEGVDESDEDRKLYTPSDSIEIYELDILTLELELMCSGPDEEMLGVGLSRSRIKFSSDAHFIYFGQAVPGTPVLTYSVRDMEWDCLPPPSYIGNSLDGKRWIESAFKPGLSPFMKP